MAHSQCADGRTGIACSLCYGQLVPNLRGGCSPCESTATVVPLVFGVAFFLCLVGFYVTRVKFGSYGRPQLLLVLVASLCSQLFSMAQFLGTLQFLRIEWQ